MSPTTSPTRQLPPLLKWLAAFLILSTVLSLAITLGFVL